MKKEMKNQTFLVILMLLASFSFFASVVNTKVLKNGNLAAVMSIYGESMDPTLKHQQKILVHHSNTFEAGDIIVANVPSEGEDMKAIKRIIGVPGDEVEIKDAKVYLNGHELKENYLKEEMYDSYDYKTTLGEDQYWIMGDNRNVSQDSRQFGPIQQSKILYKYSFGK